MVHVIRRVVTVEQSGTLLTLVMDSLLAINLEDLEVKSEKFKVRALAA